MHIYREDNYNIYYTNYKVQYMQKQNIFSNQEERLSQ
jgi:hypothetical protein